MIRRSPYFLPAIGGALLAAGFVGVQLGESAIAGINPIFFQGEPERPRGIDPDAVRPSAQSTFAQAYGFEDGAAARAAACDNCGYSPATETHAFAEGGVAPLPVAQSWRDVTPLPDPAPWEPGRVSVHRGSDVTRYTDFPIEDKPAAADDAPEAVEPPADDE